MSWQVVEKDGYGTDWAPVRYTDRALMKFASKDDAMKAATDYLNGRNCDNALTADEKRANIEAFMMTENGCFLGILDGKQWYLTYQKDIRDRKTNEVYAKGSPVKDMKYFELEGKTEVMVRQAPGT